MFLPIDKFILNSSIPVLAYYTGRFCVIIVEETAKYRVWLLIIAAHENYLEDLNDTNARGHLQRF